MAYTRIASDSAGSGAGFDVTTSAIDTTGADFIVVSVAFLSGGTFTLSDSKSNTWTTTLTKYGTIISCQLLYCVPTSVGSSHTFTVTSAGILPSIGVIAFSGGKQTSPFDVENGANGGAGLSNLSTGSITPSEDNELIISCVGIYDHASPGFVVTESMTVDGDVQNTGGHYGLGMAYKIQTSAAAINPNWSTNATYFSAAIASFKAAAAGGATWPGYQSPFGWR